MQSYEQILATLCKLLQAHAKEDLTVEGKTLLTSELGLDSALLMEILLEIEDEFDVSIPLNTLPDIYDVKDMARMLEKLLNPSQ
jgi:acyl carrier protein